jgi:hypothetical protein
MTGRVRNGEAVRPLNRSFNRLTAGSTVFALSKGYA